MQVAVLRNSWGWCAAGTTVPATSTSQEQSSSSARRQRQSAGVWQPCRPGLCVRHRPIQRVSSCRFSSGSTSVKQHCRVPVLMPAAQPLHRQTPRGMCCASQALAERERAVREGRLATIIFLRVHNSRGQESSAFIDYGERLRAGDMNAFFAGSKLEPAPSDLSYYNWTTRTAKATESSSFEVCASCHIMAFAAVAGAAQTHEQDVSTASCLTITAECYCRSANTAATVWPSNTPRTTS